MDAGSIDRRPRRKPGSVAADKAYSNSLIRRYLRRRGISHTIPEKSGSQAARRRKGSRGGRPPGFDAERYKKRNTVERAINLSHDKYCSASIMIAKTAELTHSFDIVPA